MPELSTRLIDLQASSGGDPDDWDGGVLERGAEVVKSRRDLSPRRHQPIHITK
jgi:hypothetical protein